MDPAIFFAPAARREIRKFDAVIQKRVVEAVERLGASPRPRGVEKLTDYPGFFRLSVGRDHRVIYYLSGRRVVVLVVRDRKDAYRGLDSLQGKLAAAMSEIAVAEQHVRLIASR